MKCRATAGNGLYTSDTIVEAPVRCKFLILEMFSKIYIQDIYTSDTIVEAPVRCKTLIRAMFSWLQNFHPQFQYQKPLPMDKMFMLANIKLDAYF